MKKAFEHTVIQHKNIRRRYIHDRIKEGDAVRISELAVKFGCSLHTVRNDLRYLRELGIEAHTKRGVLSANTRHLASIIREIKFPANYKDAGVSILAYFSKVLSEKYPDTDASVVISQYGDLVTLKIESDEGELERIEETLVNYGKVVKGEISPKELLPNAIASLELSNKLELAKMELRLSEQSFSALSAVQNSRIMSLETQVSELRSLIGSQLGAVQSLAESLAAISKSNSVSESVAKAIDTIVQMSNTNHSKINEKVLTKALLTVKNENESMFVKIKDSILSFSNSISANIATPWVITVLNSLPK